RPAAGLAGPLVPGGAGPPSGLWGEQRLMLQRCDDPLEVGCGFIQWRGGAAVGHRGGNGPGMEPVEKAGQAGQHLLKARRGALPGRALQVMVEVRAPDELLREREAD